MIKRRGFLTGAAVVLSAAAGVAAGYAGRNRIASVLDNEWHDRAPLPAQALISAEFMNGDMERVGDLLLSRSEAKWLRDNHGGVTDPLAIVRLLSPC